MKRPPNLPPPPSHATHPLWSRWHQDLAPLSTRQLFFLGGTPRSGTTWLQQMLNAHPDISCAGEAHFSTFLAAPIDSLMSNWRGAVAAKNAIFPGTGGYKLPPPEDADILLGTAILLALHRQSAGTTAHAIGEKTPENVFFFPRLHRIFPAARFIGIARDPRDVLTSAWHFFHKPAPGEHAAAAKLAFVRGSLPSLQRGLTELLAFAESHPASMTLLTYESLLQNQPAILVSLCRQLGVSTDPQTLATCISRTSFASLAGGRRPGTDQPGAFYRKGVAGDWPATLTPDCNALILRDLGWMFPRFGWTP